MGSSRRNFWRQICRLSTHCQTVCANSLAVARWPSRELNGFRGSGGGMFDGAFHGSLLRFGPSPPAPLPRRGEGGGKLGYSSAERRGTPKNFWHPLGFWPSIVYNRTNTGRRETGEFLDKLIAEVCGRWGVGARGGKEPGFEIGDVRDRRKARLQRP